LCRTYVFSPWCVVGGPFRGCAAPRSLGRVLFWFFSVVCGQSEPVLKQGFVVLPASATLCMGESRDAGPPLKAEFLDLVDRCGLGR
jgi:hypothetical protein